MIAIYNIDISMELITVPTVSVQQVVDRQLSQLEYDRFSWVPNGLLIHFVHETLSSDLLF